MKITWNKNPLLTTVEIDDAEKDLLRHKIHIEQLEERLYEAVYLLDNIDKPPKNRTTSQAIEAVKKTLSPDYIFSEGSEKDTGIDRRVEEILQCYIDDLLVSHCGDCVCVACSCTKCHAETLLGIDTIPGLGKHPANKIAGAFGKDNERTIEEAIAHLEGYDPTPPTTNLDGWAKVGGWEQHVPRWKNEAASAAVWLKKYKEEHFP